MYPICSNVLQNNIYTSTINVKNGIYTNNIEPFNNNRVQIDGLTPKLIVANIPIEYSNFGADGDFILGYINNTPGYILSISESHFIASSVDTQLLVQINNNLTVTTLDNLNGPTVTPNTKFLTGSNTYLASNSYLTVKLNGAIPTNLSGCIITITIQPN